MPTIGAFLQLLPSGFVTRPYRSTDSTIFLCLEGSGRATIEGKDYEFGQNDVFVIPSWNTFRLHAEAETVLFSYSDRPVQKALGLWREQRL